MQYSLTFTDLYCPTKVYSKSDIRVYSFTPPLKGVKRKSKTVTLSKPYQNACRIRSTETVSQVTNVCNFTSIRLYFRVFLAENGRYSGKYWWV